MVAIMKKKLLLVTFFTSLLFSSNAMSQTELEKLRSEVDALNKKAQEWEQYQAPKKKIQADPLPPAGSRLLPGPVPILPRRPSS